MLSAHQPVLFSPYPRHIIKMRIASLSAAAIDWLIAMKAAPLIVGRSFRYVGKRLEDAVVVSNFGVEKLDSWFVPERHDVPDVAALENLSPDLIVAASSAQARLIPEAVPEARVINFEPGRFGEILKAVLHLGNETGCTREAMEVVGRFERDLTRRRAAAGLERHSEPRARVALITSTTPLSSGGYWCSDLIELAGGAPVLSEAGAPPRPVSMEELDAAADVIFIPASLKSSTPDELDRFEVLPAECPVFDPAPGLYRTIAYLISRIA